MNVGIALTEAKNLKCVCFGCGAGWLCVHPDIKYKGSMDGELRNLVVKNPPANAGDLGSSPGPGRSHMHQSN